MASETRSARSRLAGTANSDPSVRSAQRGIFRKEGEYWTVGYDGNAFRLKDARGLGYIAHLLRHPAVEFHVLDLFGGIAGQRTPLPAEQEIQKELLDDVLRRRG
jgi:hypothetical protein